ncbi:MAG: N-acetylmuramoyl-L-alanine amidase [Acidobacteriota bacterium]|nr:N-acetylmuramoyl-L-alanine amidase [Acidobacteriota bacterium]
MSSSLIRRLLLAGALVATSGAAAESPRDIPLGRWQGAVQRAEVESSEAVALSWSAGCAAAARVRASDDGVTWNPWVQVAIDEDVTERSEGRYFSAITHFGAARRYIEVSLARPDCSIDGVTLTIFPPAAKRLRAAAQSFSVGPVEVRSRADWGCPDGEGSRWTPAYTTVTHAVVHHTDGANTVADWDAELRNIWYFHTVTRGWGDIGYNYLIDPNGVVYEGRAGSHGAIGAHFSCRNTNTVGVAMLGTYTSVLPSPAALASLRRLLAELCRLHAIDPTATVYHPPTALDLPAILGHRDGNPSKTTCSTTDCPGDALYQLLPTLRIEVAASCSPIAIERHPASVMAAQGTSWTLTVTASGTTPFRYQWYAGLSPDTSSQIAGATGATLMVPVTGGAAYWVRVTNDCGTADSTTAFVNTGPAQRRRAARP